ncbi:MAG: glycoside hydrolase TIM-barrel-like domain-containing protein [Roseibium sp.]|nr:glycoside hydrolase TIM-barrel-like domain-containing protein [Roseibium sp.]
MATLLLGAAASAVVGATGAGGLVANAITSAATIAGSLIDSALFSAGGGSQSVEGPRLQDLQVLSSTEGAPIPIIAGFARVSGQVIWATNLEEEVRTDTQKTGGKGGGGASTTTTTYSYFGNFAVGLCEGEVAQVLRVWADGKELDMTTITHRIYRGTETQLPDPLIDAKQGSGNAPAYRGLAYIVFERLPLADFGNRIPQLTFEVIRSVGYEEEALRGLCLIPGSTEFGYEPTLVQDIVSGTSKTDNNRHTKTHATDWAHSLDLLSTVCPNVDTVALVVAWFGTDSRCGNCVIEPRIEAVKATTPIEWQVAGLTRDTATVVSYVDGKPAFGGSPNDASVIAAIQDLKSRGLTVLLYPFIMMDVPSGNGLPDPYGGSEQAVYPWRGRITCHPAPGQPGTVDQTAAAETQVTAFLGTASPSDFGGMGNAVTYSGPAEWSYRRFILHLAKLTELAGGVDAFCVGTEMVGMTGVRGAGSTFPFVDGLVSLLTDVRSMLGHTVKLGYAADWSEYHSYRPADGSADVFFHLDPVWSHPDCDFIGIDNYLPLSDWRDTPGHLDQAAGHSSIHDPEYLTANIEGGEYYDWFYASDADRAAQVRTPITDGAYGDPWIYRNKDLRNWWQNAHRNRPGGTKGGTLPTEWHATSTTALVLSDVTDDGTGQLTLTLSWTVDNSGGGGTVFPRFRVLNGALPAAGSGEDWTGAVTGRVISASHEVKLLLEEVSAGFSYLTGSSVTLGAAHQTHDISRTFSNANAAYARLLIGPNVPAGAVFTAELEIALPVLTQTGGANSLDTTFAGAVSGDVFAPSHQTAFVPEAKPIWFTEFGCPGIDKGTNQPNVFYDPKSSESFVPHFSSGARDDLIQRRYLRAITGYWADAANNPVSGVTGQPMLDVNRFYAWSWDVRPFPSFPVDSDIWADHANFTTGHWLSRRMGGATADGIARLMMEKSGLTETADFDVTGFAGVADGFIIDRVTSARAVIDQLGTAMAFDPVESGGRLEARSRRHGVPVMDLDPDRMLDRGRDTEPMTIRRAQETDLPKVVRVTAYDGARDFELVTGEGLLEMVSNDRVVVTDTPIVADFSRVQALAEFLLHEAWAGRETYAFGLPDSLLALEPGDVVSFLFAGRPHTVRLSKVTDGAGRRFEAKSYDGPVYEPRRGTGVGLRRIQVSGGKPLSADAVGVFIDGPLLRDTDTGFQGYVTGFKLPFRPGLGFLSSPSESGFVTRASLDAPGQIGVTLSDLSAGPLYRWDRTNTIDVEISSGTLQSLEDIQVFAGGNAALIQSASGEWELLQFAHAELTGTNTYRLSKLLRGQKGSEAAMGAPGGARIVFLAGSIAQPTIERAQLDLPLNWQVGPAGAAVGSPAFQSYQVTMTGKGERPLSPVHLRAAEQPGGDLLLTWIRRTRIGGDGWEQAEVPLGEDTEAYDIEIRQGGTLRRTFETPSPSVIYTAADQATDLGAAGLPFTWSVFQISATYGRGMAKEAEYQP